MARFSCGSLLPFVLLSVQSYAAPDVLTVNIGGDGDFTDIQEAVDHAQAGDTILVWGPANSFQVLPAVTITKGLTLFGLATERVHLDDLTIRNVPAGESVTIVGFSVGESGAYNGTYPFDDRHRAAGATIEDCAGPVILEGCYFQGGWEDPGGPGLRAIRSDVALLGCEVYGGSLGDAGSSRTGIPNRQHGLVLEDARAFVSRSNLRGQTGDYTEAFEPSIGGDGGDGARVSGASSLWLLGATVLGGEGYIVEGLFPGWAYGGDGGAGVRLTPECRAFARATFIRGGDGGYGTDGSGADGEDVSGHLTLHPGVSLRLDTATWIREGDAVTATIRGEPGAPAYLLLGENPGFRWKGRGGVLLVEGGTRIPLGALPASGQVTVSVPVPALGTGEVRRLLLQSAVQESTGLAYGEARALVAIDASWLPERTRRVFVDASAAPGGDGRSWSTAFRDLRQGLEAARGLAPTNTDVWVREGVYRPVPTWSLPIEPFFVKSRTRVFGGFAGTETDLSQRDASAHPTILSGDLLGDDTAAGLNRGENSRSVLAVGPWVPREHVRLDGLVVRSGHGAAVSGYATPFRGVGVELWGLVDVVGCTFADNRLGCALFARDDSDVRVVGCRFLGNRNPAAGTLNGFGTCTVGRYGGHGHALVADSEFIGNSTRFGGGLYLESEARVVNCSFFGNEADFDGGAVYAGGPSLVIENSLSWQNVSPGNPDFLVDPALTATRIDSSLFLGGSSSPFGTGNIEGPPDLADPDGPDGILGTLDDDLTPLGRSPAIDAGTNAFLPPDVFDLDRDGDTAEPLPVDAVGRLRFVDDPRVPDTGSGTPPIVDIGSRERP